MRDWTPCAWLRDWWGSGISSIGCIGALCLTAQVGTSQTAAPVLMLDDASGEPWSGLSSMLRADRSAQWQRAFALAHGYGPALEDGCWRRIESRRSKPAERLLWTAAYAAALGAGDRGRLVRRALAKATPRHERLLALIAVALAPQRPGDAAAWSFDPRDLRLAAERVAVGCALGRRAQPSELPKEWFLRKGRDDPGLAAAAVLCGSELPQGQFDRWTGPGELSGAGALVARAAFLTDHGAALDAGGVEELAARALGVRGNPELVRAAAIYLGTRPGAAVRGLPSLEAEAVGAFAASQNGRRAALARGWLAATPSGRFESDLRRRLTVAFVLSAERADLERAAAGWLADADVRGDVTLALAFRRAKAQKPWEIGTWAGGLLDIKEGSWLRLAEGEGVGEGVAAPEGEGAFVDAERAARRGALPVDAIAAHLARELWRRGSHPGRARQMARSDLIRDLLLTGADYVQSRLLRRGAHYLPDGLQPGERMFFEPAYLYFDWYVGKAAGPDDLERLR